MSYYYYVQASPKEQMTMLVFLGGALVICGFVALYGRLKKKE